MQPIRHVWFDLGGTLTMHTPEFDDAHNQVRYQAYSDATGRPISSKLIAEFHKLYQQKGSCSAVFRSLGFPSDYWIHYYNTLNQSKYFKPTPQIRETIKKLRRTVPVSLFTNVNLANAMRILGVIDIPPDWFTYMIDVDDILNRKPALDGFYLMIEKSQLPPEQILYVGDRVSADIKPANAVGLRTCLAWDESTEADYYFKTFDSLLSFVG